MTRMSFLPLAFVLSLTPAVASAQQPAPAAVQTTTVGISRVTLFRVATGQGAAFNRDMADNLIPIWEAYKKAGLLTSYTIFTKATTDTPEDWTVGISLTYPNWATLDGFGAKANPITLAHYGTAEKRTAAGAARQALRTVVSSFLVSNVTLTR